MVMAGFTNRGKKRLLDILFRSQQVPAHFYIAMFTNAVVPTVTINTVSDLAQISTGNGYQDGGYELTTGSADFDYISEDDALNKAVIQIKNISWTATGGIIPSSGSGARYACLTDDGATVPNRNVFCWWDLASDRYASSGNDFIIQNLQIDLTEYSW